MGHTKFLTRDYEEGTTRAVLEVAGETFSNPVYVMYPFLHRQENRGMSDQNNCHKLPRYVFVLVDQRRLQTFYGRYNHILSGQLYHRLPFCPVDLRRTSTVTLCTSSQDASNFYCLLSHVLLQNRQPDGGWSL